MRDPVSRSAGDALRSTLTSRQHGDSVATVVDTNSTRTKTTEDARRAYTDNKAKAQKSSGIFKK